MAWTRGKSQRGSFHAVICSICVKIKTFLCFIDVCGNDQNMPTPFLDQPHCSKLSAVLHTPKFLHQLKQSNVRVFSAGKMKIPPLNGPQVSQSFAKKRHRHV